MLKLLNINNTNNDKQIILFLEYIVILKIKLKLKQNFVNCNIPN